MFTSFFLQYIFSYTFKCHSHIIGNPNIEEGGGRQERILEKVTKKLKLQKKLNTQIHLKKINNKHSSSREGVRK